MVLTWIIFLSALVDNENFKSNTDLSNPELTYLDLANLDLICVKKTDMFFFTKKKCWK